MGKISDQIWACWNRAVQVFNKINEQFWVFDEKILESRLGVYVYLITSAVIIGVLAAWVVMSPGVCGGGGRSDNNPTFPFQKQCWKEKGVIVK